MGADKNLVYKLNSQLNDIVKQQKVYKDKNTLRPFLLESFKNTAEFTPTNGTVSQDTSTFKTGTSALKFVQTTADLYTAFEKTVSWNVANATDFELNIYVPDNTKLASITLYFMNASGGEFHKGRNIFYKGWNTLRFPKPNSTWASSGTITWNDTITKVIISIGGTAGQTPTIMFDSLKKDVVEPLRVIFTSDDGYSSAYNEFCNYLESNGFRGSLAIYNTVIDTANHMTTAQVIEKYNSGHDVLNHSSTHPDFSTKTYTQTAVDIQTMTEWLYNNGIRKGLNMFMYPNAYTDMACQVIKDLGFVLGRDSAGSHANYNKADDMYRLRSIGLNASSVLTDFTTYFNSALITGGTIIVYVHDIQDTPTGIHVGKAFFRQVVDTVKTSVDAGQCKVMTFTQWYDDLFN